MRAQESWFLHGKQCPDSGERYTEKKCLNVFCSKMVYSSNLLSCGAAVISVAIVLKDKQFHLWPKGRCGLLYCTLFFQACVCTDPFGGITGDCPCINHHQWLINNVCVFPFAQAVQEKQQAEVAASPSLNTDLLHCLWYSNSSEKGMRKTILFSFYLKYLLTLIGYCCSFATNATVQIFIEIKVCLVECVGVNSILST